MDPQAASLHVSDFREPPRQPHVGRSSSTTVPSSDSQRRSIRRPRRCSKSTGVGQLTALTYVLTLGSKERFQRSRDVGCYLGLRPRRSQSGDHDPQLGITKAGNIYLRSLLVERANHVLGPRGRDSTLRQWGLHLASRGGKQSRNRAIVAVARKLAVLLHRIWVTQEPCIPFYAVAA